MTKRTDAKSPTPKGDGLVKDAEARDGDHGDNTGTPDPEVVARPQRRRFTAEYKEQILKAVDALNHGEIGPFLRREGLAHSMVSRWRKERDLAVLRALKAKKPGPVPKEPDPRDVQIRELERKLRHTEKELSKAKSIIDVQKKVSELLAQGLSDENGETS